MLAVRGNPLRVVQRTPRHGAFVAGWTADPLKLRVTGDRAIGLGACDIKGAAAGLIAAANRTRGDVAFLFSSDEEANDARCIEAFLASDGMDSCEAIVAEPTAARRCSRIAGSVRC